MSPARIASDGAELVAADALAAEMRAAGVASFADYRPVRRARASLAAHMAAVGLVGGADPACKDRIIATAELILSPAIRRHEKDSAGNLGPIQCPQCDRAAAFDDERAGYRHLISPERGCYYIAAEPEIDDDH